jgi:hypothetical protein
MKRFATLLAASALVAAAGPAQAMDFRHDAHLAYTQGDPCTICHVPEDRTIVPDTARCLDCHDADFLSEVKIPGTATHGPLWTFQHSREARAQTYDCAACHQQNFCLECHKSGFADEQGSFGNAMNNVHRSDFHVTHPIAARTDPRLCASCHESRFCTDCHTDFRVRGRGASHRRTFALGGGGNIEAIHRGMTPGTACDVCHLTDSVAPSFHQWRSDHAREARKNLVTCQACHPGGDTCLKCHSARGGAGGFNPHGKGWKDRADRLDRASDGRTCKKCH